MTPASMCFRKPDFREGNGADIQSQLNQAFTQSKRRMNDAYFGKITAKVNGSWALPGTRQGSLQIVSLNLHNSFVRWTL